MHIKLALQVGGGYSEPERRLPESIRKEVYERDGGRWRQCGGLGSQIDHINGSSNNLGNLQLLCVSCHNAKTQSQFVSITEETHPEEWAKSQSLIARIESPEPMRLCDSEEWEGLWRSLQSERRRILKLQEMG